MARDFASRHQRHYVRPRAQYIKRALIASLCLAVMAGLIALYWRHVNRPAASPMPVIVEKQTLPIAKPKPSKPRFAFYEILPKMQVDVKQSPEAIIQQQSKTTVPEAPVATTPEQAPTTEPLKTAQPTLDKQTQEDVLIRRYFLQVASFVRTEDAERLKTRLLLLGFNAKVDEFQGVKKKFYRVILGPFSRMDIAEQAQKRLAQSHYRSMLLTIKKTG